MKAWVEYKKSKLELQNLQSENAEKIEVGSV